MPYFFSPLSVRITIVFFSDAFLHPFLSVYRLQPGEVSFPLLPLFVFLLLTPPSFLGTSAPEPFSRCSKSFSKTEICRRCRRSCRTSRPSGSFFPLSFSLRLRVASPLLSPSSSLELASEFWLTIRLIWLRLAMLRVGERLPFGYRQGTHLNVLLSDMLRPSAVDT